MKILVLLWLSISTVALAASSVDLEKLLMESDRYRGGASSGMEWEMKLHAVQDGNTTDTTYEVQVKGVNVLARCTAPARQKDEVYLFNDRNLWVYRPNLRKPISVSPRQRLSGQASNGDIATTNYARDYTAVLLGEEMLAGTPVLKLSLKARAPQVTYDAITYWVGKNSKLGLKADFLTLEGKVFKSATFEYDNKVANHPMISKMTVVDAQFPKNVTTLSYGNPRAQKLSDGVFNVNNLAR